MKPELEWQASRRKVFALQSRLCKAMGHPTRLEIVDWLASGETHASGLVRSLEISKATLSKHMTLLVAAGIVAERRKGREVRYRLTCPEIHGACEMMRSILLHQLREAGSLASAVEQLDGEDA